MGIDSRKLTGSLKKFKVPRTYPWPKPNGFQNNNDNTKKRESLLVQSIAVTIGVGVTNQQPEGPNRRAIKHCMAEDVGS